MSSLSFKTRENLSPNGKSRVYFCCHPMDFEKYFETISNEILSKQNCVIWYKNNFAKEPDELFYSDLLQMQLFIIPITANFLTTANQALDVEFKFAIKHNIPVLPLMQEDGLEELFNEKCGELQFLHKNKIDRTAISYDEKLEKFLVSTLISDELVEKIKAAFDAYIFLSYRKKDRKYAQELMKLIHKNKFCRDIAIWYDEFLVPGENFNDSIKSALEKSELFVMTVTPNLVNETNYILTTEYPLAKKLDKTILPAELVPTDKDELSKKYTGIPSCTNARIPQELTDSLLSTLKNLALKNDDSPEHNFFIGLAYLAGIDVEIDHKKSLDLITGAANSGLYEAKKKLVNMYQYGTGVAINYCEAIKWQVSIVESFANNFDTFNNPEGYQNYLSEIYDLLSLYYECNDYENAIKTEELYVNKPISKEIVTDKIQSRLLDIYKRIGDFYYNAENIEKASEYFSLALNGYNNLYNSSKKAEIILSLIDTYNSVGLLLCEEKKYDQALKYFVEALSICKELSENNENLLSILASCNNNVALAYHKQKLFGSAESFYIESIKIKESIFAHSPKSTAINLAISYDNLAQIYAEQGQFKQAEELYGKAINICKENTPIEVYAKHVSRIYTNLSVMYMTASDYNNAELSVKKSLELFELTKTNINAYDYSNALSTLGVILLNTNNYKTSIEKNQAAFDILNELNKKSSNIYTYELLGVNNNIASAFFALGNFDNSIKYYENSIKICKDYLSTNDNKEIMHIKAQCLLNIATIYLNSGDNESAVPYIQEASISFESLVYNNQTIDVINELIYCYDIALHIFPDKTKRSEFQTYMSKKIDILETVNNNSDITIIVNLVKSYIALGKSNRKSEKYPDAKMCFTKAKDLMENHLPNDEIEIIGQLAFIYHQLGDLYYLQRDPSEAYKMLNKALEFYVKVELDSPGICTDWYNETARKKLCK